MVVLTEDINRLFDETIEKISKNVRQLMENLWRNWSHLGVDEAAKVQYIKKLVLIEKDLHQDVIMETTQKLKNMQEEVEKLKQETDELSKCLSVDISILEFKEDMWLIDYMRELEEQIAGYREQVQIRRMEIERLSQWQRDLSEKLGATIQELPDIPLPSEEELDRLKNRLQSLQGERDKRVETFLRTQVEIKDIMEKLQIQPQNKFEQLVVTSLSVDFKVTDVNMDRLAKLHQELQEKYEHTNNRVLELRERLSRLWECLEEEQLYRDHFLQAHPGCHPLAETAIKEEINRCEAIKRQKIQVFVSNMRTKIKLMWDTVMYSRSEREQFVHYYQDVFTEDTLTLHEMYLDTLNKYYEEHKNIFDLVVTRRNLWLKMTELEGRATEPGRYHNRGGQLLLEEKERKAIANKLPKIEERLRAMVMEYEERTGKVFTVNGSPLLKLIDDEWETRKAERHNKVSARRAGALTPTRPGPLRAATSPRGKRNRTAAGLPATPLTDNRQPKRLMTASAAKAMTSLAGNLSALKRTAISTVKRRISGRLAARAVAGGNGEKLAKRKLDLGVSQKKQVNGSILKHKRTSQGKRRSSARLSKTMSSEENGPKNPLLESTMMTTYTDFKERINEDKVSRSSLATNIAPHIVICPPNNTPKQHRRPNGPMTPKTGKENIQHTTVTPKPNSLLYTPQRHTRSAVKTGKNDGFATPRAPLSAAKPYVRQNTVAVLSVNSPAANVSRSKSHTNLVRVKNLPPLI